jgi:hypothetical protein
MIIKKHANMIYPHVMPKSKQLKQISIKNTTSEKISISPMQTIEKNIYGKKEIQTPSIEVARSVEQHGSSFNLIFKKAVKDNNLISIN